MQSVIRIWKFSDAPQHLKDLHPHGSESTWVMEAPAGMSGEAESIIAERPHQSDISRYELGDGTLVFFGESSSGRKSAASGSM